MGFSKLSYKIKIYRSEKVAHVLHLLIDSILKRFHLCVIMPTSSGHKKQLDKELHDAAERSKTLLDFSGKRYFYNKCLLNM